MKLRVARHTTNLKPLIAFYTDVIGLTVLGQFKDHAGYDGIFIGNNDWHWHLEFTTSAETPRHHADDDDMLVFYAETQEAYHNILEKAIKNNIPQTEPKNPYWKKNAVTLIDPDGFRVVITIVGN